MHLRYWRHRVKPPLGTPTDPTHPLLPTFGLTFLRYEDSGTNAQIGAIGTLAQSGYNAEVNFAAGTAPQPTGNVYGRAAVFDGVDDRVAPRDRDGNPFTWNTVMSTTAKTVVCGLTITGTAAAETAVYELPAIFSDSGAAFLGMHRGDYNSNGDAIYAYNYDGSEDTVKISFTVGKPIVAAYTHDGVTLSGYGDGALTAQSASGTTTDVSGTLTIGRDYDATAFLACSMEFIYFYNRVLTAGQIASLSASPYQFFYFGRPLSALSAFPVVTAAGGGGGGAAQTGKIWSPAQISHPALLT